jgi:hypothetical protein
MCKKAIIWFLVILQGFFLSNDIVFSNNVSPSTEKDVAANTSSETSCYSADWRYWSQGASRYTNKNGSNSSGMRNAGCRVVSQAKLLVEAGIAPSDADVFNPDIFFEWGNENSYFGDKGDLFGRVGENKGIGSGMIAYAKEAGFELTKGHISLSGYGYEEKDKIIMEYLEKGYYVIIGGSGHHAYVGREESLKIGKPIVWDSGKTKSYSASHRREGTKEAASKNRTVADNLYYYELKTFVIVLDYNNGTARDSGRDQYREIFPVNPGDHFSFDIRNPEREGFVFVGWSRNPNAAKIEYKSEDTIAPNKSETFFAIYRGVSFTIVYHKNTFFNWLLEKKKSITYTFEDNNIFSCDIFARNNQYIASWNTERNGSGRTYYAGQCVNDLKPKDGSIIYLYAQWEKGSPPSDPVVTPSETSIPPQPPDVVPDQKPQLSISGANYPSTLHVGDNFGLRGTVKTDCGTITEVQGGILDSTGAEIQSSSFSPNKTTHDLRRSINTELEFGLLSAGDYIYRVIATATNGEQTTTKTLIDTPFTIVETSDPDNETNHSTENYLGVWEKDERSNYTISVFAQNGSTISIEVTSILLSGGANVSAIDQTTIEDIILSDGVGSKEYIDSWGNEGVIFLSFSDGCLRVSYEVTKRGELSRWGIDPGAGTYHRIESP